MKATGIVRRIDDLGRVVIPKEIRRTLRIREGDPLEIFTSRDGEVIFKKYSPIGELVDFAGQYAESLYKTCGFAVAVCDRDSVIAVSGVSKKEFIDKKVSSEIDGLIDARTLYTCRTQEPTVPLVDDTHADMYAVCAMPIFAEGDVIGCVAMISPAATFAQRTEKNAMDTEIKLIQTAASFLGKQIES